MFKIWMLILAGIIFVPLISTVMKELEERLEGTKNNKNGGVGKGKLKSKDDLEFTIKLLKYAVIILFVIITIVMIRFTAQIISSK